MKDAYLTLRLSAELAESLEARALRDEAPKSQVVREAVVRYLTPKTDALAEEVLTARALAARWSALPHLSPEEAAALATDIECATEKLPLPTSPWE